MVQAENQGYQRNETVKYQPSSFYAGLEVDDFSSRYLHDVPYKNLSFTEEFLRAVRLMASAEDAPPSTSRFGGC